MGGGGSSTAIHNQRPQPPPIPKKQSRDLKNQGSDSDYYTNDRGFKLGGGRGGISTGVAFDIHRQFKRSCAKQTADEEKSKATAFVRQVAQVKMAAAVMLKGIMPA